MNNSANSFWRLRISIALVGLPASLTPATAQEASGRILGVVTDPSGSVIQGAKVTVTNVDTGINSVTTTKGDGAYQVLLLPVGSYRVAAEARGFRTALTEPQKLEINQSLK